MSEYSAGRRVYGLGAKKKAAAEATGLDEDKIGVIKLQLSALRNLGLAVDLEVSGMSMGVTSAGMADFGIADEDDRLKRLRGGTKLLFKEAYYKELRSCESSYRQLLKKYSYKVAGHDWIPFTAWAKYRDEAEVIEARFAGVVRKIIANLDQQLADYETDVRGMYAQAWAAIKSQDYDAIKVRGRVYSRPSEFVEEMTAQALRKFPTCQQIAAGIRMDYRTSVIGDVADFQADELTAQRLAEKRQKLEDRRQKALTLAEMEKAELYARRDAIRQAELEHRRKQLAEMKSPLDDLANEMRRRVGEAVAGMLESVKKNGSIRGKVAEQALNLKALYQTLAVTSDAPLEKALEDLAGMIGGVGRDRAKDAPERDVDSIRAAMLEIVDLASQEVETVAVADRLAMLEL